jgi:NADH-quinone oxidoreductase subunit N
MEKSNTYINNIGTNLSELSYNIIIFIPEIFLGISLIILLGYGVIYSKIGGLVSQLKKITNLTILSLIIAIYLIVDLNINILNNISNTSEIISTVLNTEIISTTLNNKIENKNLIMSHSVGSIDNLTLLVKIIIIISAIAILIMSKGVYSNKKEKIIDYEYTQLIMLSTLGMLLLVSSRDLIIMYLSIETVSLSLYILAAIRKTGQLSTEAGLKYFILGALSSGLLLFGCALIYITTGLIDFNSLTYFIYNNISNNLVGIEIGAIFIIFAILFKLAAAPFHM